MTKRKPSATCPKCDGPKTSKSETCKRCRLETLAVAREAVRSARKASPTRTCPKCGETKPREDFPRGGEKVYGYCKPCHSTYQRTSKLRLIYGLMPEEADAIATFQGGVCPICLRKPLTTELAIDHAHKSGLIRGRLCWICNRLLGTASDDPARLRRAAAYLEDPPAVHALGREVYGRKGRTTNKAKKPRKKKTA